LGGRELNYSSDIDLMFVYSNNGDTTGGEPVSNKEFFKKLCTKLTELLSAYTPYGFCYRVDLRLRPEGSLGDVCISMEGARDYYQKRARDWELQMLIKARAAAGDRSLGRHAHRRASYLRHHPRLYGDRVSLFALSASAKNGAQAPG
jgi:glutamate-ammonia-ligase adenylyltransferase